MSRGKIKADGIIVFPGNIDNNLRRSSSSPANWWKEVVVVSPEITSSPQDYRSFIASFIGLGSLNAVQVIAILSPFFRQGGLMVLVLLCLALSIDIIAVSVFSFAILLIQDKILSLLHYNLFIKY
jgi:hypothetical protein